jgi:SAM-dependent methyltransferase
MDLGTRARLLALNRAFYAAVAEPFDQTRRVWPPGKRRLLELLPHGDAAQPLTVTDIGCGNGRLAAMLDSRGTPVDYVGVDADPSLLDLARAHCAGLLHVRARFVQADLATPDWTRVLGDSSFRFDAVVCLATLQHLPGFDLRATVVGDLARLAAGDGQVILSAWQFLTSARFTAKVIPWASVGLAAQQVEPGDALLPWTQGVSAVRYVHQIDLAEMQRLAEAAGLVLVDHFYADGKEGNLNLYGVFRKNSPQRSPRTHRSEE